MQQKPKEKEVPKAAPPKDKELPKEMVPKEKDLHREEIKRDPIERFAPPFNLQAEFSKIKIVVSFTEIIRIPENRGQLSHMLQSQETSDTLIFRMIDQRLCLGLGLKHLLNVEISLHFTSPSPFMICIYTMQCLIQVPLTT